ncbi:hypothetical protein N1851_031198 [Merluccius polli]|uniref:Uncharacterized protein n=1 Tax=Merluccius polli TaxID=89951 RepID=A0AA47M481_MERPO|nr:hypothetical protein N1851_031198 [Merluccius polli]
MLWTVAEVETLLSVRVSAAEKQRRYRARRDADPARRAAYLEKQRQAWHRLRAQGKVKTVAVMSEREKRSKRAYWRKAQQEKRERQRRLDNLSTPPDSPDSQRTTDKLRKRLKRQNQASESPASKTKRLLQNVSVSHNVRRSLLAHHALMANIKDTFATTKKKTHRQVMARLVTGRILKKYGLQKEISAALRVSRKWKKNLVDGKMRYRSLCSRLQDKVIAFLTMDESSRLTAGKAQTITRAKIKKQKRFLNDTLRNLHRKFLTEHPHLSISYSLFCRMRPFWVVSPTLSDRETCLCKVHENLSFLVEKLHTLKLIRSVDVEDMVSSITCNPNLKDCMYNVCPDCKGQEFAIVAEGNLQEKVQITQEKKNNDGEKEKVPVRITVKKKKDIEVGDLLEMFQSQLSIFKQHFFNIKSQFSHYRELRRSMSNLECLIHVDFSENYSCKLAAEIQAMHFASNQKQATLHTGVLHVGGTEEHMCFGTISSSKEKGPHAIWAHLSPILDEVKKSHPSVEVVHFFSDGPTTQYRQKGNFFLFSTELLNQGFKRGTWNFFEASHGKGAPDGVGGLLKRTADRLVSQGHDISTAENLYHALANSTAVRLFYIPESQVDEVGKKMPSLTAVPSTMRIRQVVTGALGEILYRDVSCPCTTRQSFECRCDDTHDFSFEVHQTAPLAPQTHNAAASEIPWGPDLIGKWCVVRYQDDIYPGIIQDIMETHVQVKCMSNIGVNRFFWPLKDDLLWYLFEDVLRIIPPPKAVTSRHVEIDRDIWASL